MANKLPQFLLTCIKSDYPQHLLVNCRYKIDVEEKNDEKEVATYWFHPIDSKWCMIGYFSLNCFDLDPVKKYITEHKNNINNQPRERVRERSRI